MLEWCDYAIHRITNVLVVDKHMRRYVVSQGKVDFLIISCWSARAKTIIFDQELKQMYVRGMGL